MDDQNPQGRSAPSAPGTGMDDAGEYRVLARKYRPQTFEDLIGQEAMVRTLSNAFASGRVAHGFILTGVRGVGKTTTARIVARGLNCVGPDGSGGPTIHPCGTCDPCVSIAESRNVDVLEMDAASRTGIDDIREIIESVRYRPASCRYKVYIIDEVHMLSKAAFNGLLKTLEEPPPHVKFIFATTEIRKVPVTVLSRCQRFDLKRITGDVMINYLERIAKDEGCAADHGALALIARASEGSMRDAVSMLDQAIAHGTKGEDGTVCVGETETRDMLGLADRVRILDLFDLLMKADMPGALAELRAQYDAGADPITILQDLLEVTHWLTRLNIVPAAGEDTAIPEVERTRGLEMTQTLPINVLTRAWQILLKGLSEAQSAPDSLSAAEMVLVRLGFAASLKPPDDLLRMLDPASMPAGTPAASTPAGGTSATAGTSATMAPPPARPVPAAAQHTSSNGRGTVTAQATQPNEAPAGQPAVALSSFEDLLRLAEERRDIRLATDLKRHVHMLHFETGRIEFRPGPQAPKDLSSRLGQQLQIWTGQRWIISLATQGGEPTLHDVEASERERQLEALKEHPLIAGALKAFPNGELGAVRDLTVPETVAGPADMEEPPLAEFDDDEDEYL